MHTKPKVFATLALAATSASAAPSVTAEILDSISVAVIGAPADMCPIPAVPQGPSGNATAIITLDSAGEASVQVRAPAGLAPHFERAARRCVLDRTKVVREVRVEYRWEVKP